VRLLQGIRPMSFRISIGLNRRTSERFDRFMDLLEAFLETPGAAVSGSGFFTKIDGENIMPIGVISADQTSIVQDLVYRDRKGVPGAKIFGTPTVALSRDDMVSAVVNVDDPKAPFVTYTLLDPAVEGSVRSVVTAEGEETPGEQPILVEADINVVPADAETGESSFRPPT